MHARTYHIQGLVLLLTAGLLLSCSTKKNTAGTRFYHGVTAHYNTLYNGELAYKDGVEAQEKGHVDNYTELLPMYIVSDKKTAKMGSSNFDTSIEKCQKAIKKHSIKRKPKKPSGKMSERQKAFAARKEFNPYLKHAWMMFADAQLRKGDFIEAASSYNYIIRLYSDQPDVASVARAKLARCYVLMDWPYDAEDVIGKMRRDSISKEGSYELASTKAAHFIATGQYAQAIEPLKLTIKHTSRNRQKARLYYLLAQLHQLTGDNPQAYKALGKCINLNPPYELAFNARILQTEVMAEGQGKGMIRKLRRMVKNPNNANYKDRIYYAIGNIYLASRDTMLAVYAWQKGVEESTQAGYAKAQVLLHLGQLHWDMENYIDAADCYAQLIPLLDKERKDYSMLEQRSKALTDVAPALSDVKLQDSLQALAKLPEAEYLKVIDRVISELKKKEKEAEKRADAQQAHNTRQQAAQQTQQAASAKAGANRGGQITNFYFYNAQTVSQGKQTFQKRWGNRANEDNWRRSQKVTMSEDGTPLPADSTQTDIDFGTMDEETEIDEEEQARLDSLANDPHEREYYIRQLPLTDEQLTASHALISEGLYNGGIGLMEKVGNYPMAERYLLRLLRDYPDIEQKDDVYYHLFLLAMRTDDTLAIRTYSQILCDSFPDSKLTKIISNPRFLEIARYGRHLEDTLYQQTYTAYTEDKYWIVDEAFKESTNDFPEGLHRGKFLFLHAMSQLYTGHRDSFLVELKEVVEKYSQDEVSEMAAAIVKGIEDGRLLVDDKWEASSIWGKRAFGIENDSTAQADTLDADPLKPYVFVLAYPTGEVDENQLLFEIARFNFTSFVARNFEIEIVPAGMITQMRVKGFQSYDEVHAYAQLLYADSRLRTRLEGMRTLLISEDNLRLLGTRYSYDDYVEFFDSTLSPLDVPDELNIDEPDPNGPTDIDDVTESEEEELRAKDADEDVEEDDAGEDDDWMF